MIRRKGTRRSVWATIGALCSLMLWAWSLPCCVATPVGEPPLAAPDWTQITPQDPGVVITTTTTPRPYILSGQPGSAQAGTTLWAITLSDPTAPAWTTIVADDGSFDFTVQAMAGYEFRLQLRYGNQRSTPVDVRLNDPLRSTEPATLELVERVSCLVVGPTGSSSTILETDLGPVALNAVVATTVTIANNCDADYAVRNVMLRRNDRGYSVEGALPTTIAAGATGQVEVTLRASQQGIAEDILLIDVEESAPTPQATRYALTLVTLVR